MVIAHLKCFSGHFFLPCNPQGRQSSFSNDSTIAESSDKGPNPKAGIVEQNTAVTGAFTEDAK